MLLFDNSARISGAVLYHLEACLLLIVPQFYALCVNNLDVPEDFVDLLQRFACKDLSAVAFTNGWEARRGFPLPLVSGYAIANTTAHSALVRMKRICLFVSKSATSAA